MKLTHSIAALAACAALALPAARAAEPKLKLPNFSHLRAKAINSEDITIEGFLLRLAQKFSADDGDDDEDAAFLKGIKSVRVRNFEFANEGEYSRADIDSVRAQLTARTIPNIQRALDFESPELDIELVLAPRERLGLR